MTPAGRLIILSGPSAVGKGTIAKQIVSNHDNYFLSVSATTREPRNGEEEGKSYYFLTEEAFQSLIENGQMLEWATVHGKHRYGTPKEPVLDQLAQGRNVILEIDIQGARQVKASYPEATAIFIEPPSFSDLEQRMNQRGTEDSENRARRMETARIEIAAKGEFDHVVINDEVARCADLIVDLVNPN